MLWLFPESAFLKLLANYWVKLNACFLVVYYGNFHLPIMEIHFSLMMPLGSKWKSNSRPLATTVCPALFPPWEKRKNNFNNKKKDYKKFHLYEIIAFNILQTTHYHRLLLRDIKDIITHQTRKLIIMKFNIISYQSSLDYFLAKMLTSRLLFQRDIL